MISTREPDDRTLKLPAFVDVGWPRLPASTTSLRRLLIVVLLVFVGCSTTRSSRVDPRSTPTLGQNEALLVMHSDSDLPIDRINLSGIAFTERLPAGEHFWIVKVRAGDYTWQTIRIGDGDYKGRYRIKRSRYTRPGELDMTILPGRLNYAGKLMIRKGWTGWRSSSISVRLRNRAASALRQLEREQPELLQRFEVHTASTSGDRFLEFYAAEKRRVASGSEPATKEATH